jgi:hypothetical protein
MALARLLPVLRLLLALVLIWAVLHLAPQVQQLAAQALTCPPIPQPPLAGLPLNRVPAVRQSYEAVVQAFYALGTVSGALLGLICGILLQSIGQALLDLIRFVLLSLTDTLAHLADRLSPLPPSR